MRDILLFETTVITLVSYIKAIPQHKSRELHKSYSAT